MKLLKNIFNKIKNYKNKIYNTPSRKSGNKFVLYKADGTIVKNPSIPNLRIIWKGKNSTVKLHEPVVFLENNEFTLTNNNVIEIQKTDFFIKNLHIKTMTADSEFHIGNNISLNGCSVYYDVPCQKIFIGNDCMFAYDIEIWPDDGHAILDKDTLQPINYSNLQTNIGNHVWIARKVVILKNSHIPDHCIVGMGSIVNKKFSTSNSVIAGIPAKVVKTGITWDRDNTYYYNLKHMKE